MMNELIERTVTLGICPMCRYLKNLDGPAKMAMVRDCLGRCSKCGERVDSVDYLHTCRGGKLCEKCWAALPKVLARPTVPLRYLMVEKIIETA